MRLLDSLWHCAPAILILATIIVDEALSPDKQGVT
jgi:hypothetical protein